MYQFHDPILKLYYKILVQTWKNAQHLMQMYFHHSKVRVCF